MTSEPPVGQGDDGVAVALVPTALASSLAVGLARPRGRRATRRAPSQSGDRFAAAVSSWFARAMAGPFPCATAIGAARRSCAAAATAAIQAGDASLAGMQLAIGADGATWPGQVFGAGVASPPTAVGAAQSAITAVFSNLDLPRQRARQPDRHGDPHPGDLDDRHLPARHLARRRR